MDIGYKISALASISEKQWWGAEWEALPRETKLEYWNKAVKWINMKPTRAALIKSMDNGPKITADLAACFWACKAYNLKIPGWIDETPSEADSDSP